MRVTMKAQEGAAYLGISYWKILDMAKKGEIPHIRVGRLVLFRRASIDRWLLEKEEVANTNGNPQRLQAGGGWKGDRYL